MDIYILKYQGPGTDYNVEGLAVIQAPSLETAQELMNENSSNVHIVYETWQELLKSGSYLMRIPGPHIWLLIHTIQLPVSDASDEQIIAMVPSV
jgi:hypothetical protein